MEKESYLNVRDINQTLDYILEHHSSVVRYGDGEMDIIAGHSIPYQEYNEELANGLKNILIKQSTPELVVCLSDVFERLERYNEFAASFWRGHLEHYKDLYQSLCQADWYGSTFISRPYIDLVDKTLSVGYFEKLKELWDSRDILIVEGLTSRSGVGNDLFDNANSVSRIICPSRNAFSKIEEIKSEIKKYADGKLILVMLGPTAKIIAHDLSLEGYQTIDIGHIDSEYEWFKMGATHKVKLNHKHTAEHNYDQDIDFIDDQTYNSQIISNLNN